LPAPNPLRDFRVDRQAITYMGEGLVRPECILAQADGTLWTCDARGGIARSDELGSKLIQVYEADSANVGLEAGHLPNGIALMRDGSFIVANLGNRSIDRIHDGKAETLYTHVDGKPLGTMNFVLRDSKDRIWFTVMTQTPDLLAAINGKAADGYIGLIDESGIRVVADDVSGANELRFDADESHLYVVESFRLRVTRFSVGEQGQLTNRSRHGPEGLPVMPDGLAIDAAGNVWVSFIFADRLIAITPEGKLLELLDDGDAAASAAIARAFEDGAITHELMGATGGTLSRWFTSVTFGGSDLRQVYIGSALGSRLPSFRSPVAGVPPAHWNDPR
jgi:gluconolactonase